MNSSERWCNVGMKSNFIGDFRHNLDAKGRIAIPAHFRGLLGNCFTVTIGLDECITVYTEEQWDAFYEKLSLLPVNQKNPRNYMRAFTANARVCEFDAQGRILLPQSLIRYSGLVKECAVIGAGDHIEIWNAEKWEEVCMGTLNNLSDIAEELPEML